MVNDLDMTEFERPYLARPRTEEVRSNQFCIYTLRKPTSNARPWEHYKEPAFQMVLEWCCENCLGKWHYHFVEDLTTVEPITDENRQQRYIFPNDSDQPTVQLTWEELSASQKVNQLARGSYTPYLKISFEDNHDAAHFKLVWDE